jgi:large subunit ribosomal protein L25
MEVYEIAAQPRQASGTRACRRLRKENLVPAVLYGRGQDNVMLALPDEAILQALHERALVLRVLWDGSEETAQIKEVQYDAVGDNLLHVDLARISLTEKLTVTVPVKTHGEPRGVTEGGVMELIEFELDVECLPTDIPESIRVEVAELGIGESLTIADLVFPEGVTPLGEPDAVVVSVVEPVEEVVEAEVAPEAVLAEPEVIGREAKAPEEVEEEEE